MKAAVLNALNEPLEVRNDVELVELGATEVHVKIVSSGVCHSDVSAQNGTIPTMFPAVLGHEGAGIIQEVGDGVRDLKSGDRAIITFVPACNHCNPCLRGQSYLCDDARPMIMTPHFLIDGKLARGFSGCGTFAEELIVPASAVVKVDDDIPLDIVSLIGCGVTTGVGAAINSARVTPGSSVAVFGCGGVGISAIQGARIAGAAEILAVDMLDAKLDMARQFGATHVCTPDHLQDMNKQITGGEGFDFAIECIGNPVTIRGVYDSVRRGGVATIVGVGRMEEKVEFSAFELFYGNKRLQGSMYGGANVRTFIPQLLRLWKQDKLDLESMVSNRMVLDDVNEAFRAMIDGEVIRTVLDF